MGAGVLVELGRVGRLRFPAALWHAMIRHVESCLPEEGCGLVGGTDGTAKVVLPVENAAHSPVRFRMEPQAQYDAMMQLEAAGQEILAIFHSHPSGPDCPSETDEREFAYPDSAVLIFSPAAEGWRMRAFAAAEGQGFLELDWEVLPEAQPGGMIGV